MLKTKFAGLVGLTLLGLWAAPRTQGQGLGNSPYSRIGFGDFAGNVGGVRQLGMGGVGLAAPNSTNVNELNPAMLAYISRTTYEAGFNALLRRLHTVNQSNRTGSASLGYLALAVPLSKSWGAAAGLKPYTSVDYEANTVTTVAGDPDTKAQLQERGKGGLSEAYLAQGYRLGKGLAVGVTASYVFGSIDLSTGTALARNTDTAADITRVVRTEQIHYSDFAFRGALHYRGKVNDKLNYNLGGVYSFKTNLNGTRSQAQRRETLDGFEVERFDELVDQKGKSIVPALAQVGVSFDNNKNWSANVDVAHQQWSKYQAFTSSATSARLDNTLRVGVGGEYTPDATSVENYFKRITYRAGLNVAQMPYQPNGQALYDRSVSWGFAFPLPSATPLDATVIGLAFTYGQRGNLDTYQLRDAAGTRTVNNVKDDYLRLQLGVTLNNRWFIKRRIE
ncbi:Long-chain fatty acid transport protein [Hymenobacter daecheongensis DSM 21074]|uniref:Long-chain fatty acid transport protein n=1 Tax=Hymenobacter daecheongensis DSM 21074 TaxID=1121955 RepID=A0A1M6B8Q8_9BACT|nr:hypothetical protein [Hymenobacter daecheongensis]SHI45095.1 Long-chain fatty acid transport protein [Hymenobacter daecheongensis DSM 21074]